MNKKLVLTGKAVLSTVMASTMACSMLSTNILAQEPEVVPEEETTVEKTPVEEETTATEEATEVVEESTETPEEATGENSETEDLDQNGLETPETNVADSGDTEEVMTKSSQDITFNFSQGEHRRGKSGSDYSLLAYGADWVEFNGKRYTTKTDKYNNTMCVPIESIGQLINVPKGECRLITIRAGVDGDSEGITFSWYEDYKDPILTYVETGDNYVLYESDEPLSNERTNYEAYEENGRYFAKVWTDSLKTGYNKNTVADSVYPKGNCNSTWYLIYKDENGNVTTADQVTETPKMEVKTEAGLFEFNSGDVITKKTSDTVVFTGNGMKSVQLAKDLYLYGVKITNPDYSNTSLEYKIDGGLEDNAKYSVKYSHAGGDTTLLFYTDFSQGTYAATLSSTIEEYESKDLQAEDYSDASWQAYQTALTAAQQAYNDPTANNDEMKQAEADLDEAFNNLKEAIDTTKLEEAIKNFGNLEGSGSVYDNYVKVLNNGKALLEDPEATQVKVDNAARNIETCYYKVLVAALNTKYDPDTFDYSKYTTDSIIPVQNMYGITHNRTNNNYQESEAQGNIGQMALWLEKYEEAVAGLTLADQDEKYIGFNPDSTSVDDRQGHFEVTGQEVVEVDGVKKIRLHVSFYNDGLHPIYGEELPNANGSTEFDKFSIGKNDAKARVRTYTSEFGSKRTAWLKNITYLDGQTSYSKGFQGTFDIDEGEQFVTFEFTKDRDSTYSPWYYNIQPMDMVDPDCTVTYSNNGNPTNEDVTVTIQANEQLQPVEGWTLSDDGMSLTKTYSDNTSETVTVKDLTGNAIEIPVSVTGIDKEGTTVKVKNETTEDGVLVTIETSEPIQTPDGWTKVSDTKYTKLYTENTSEDIIVYDLAGNATKAHVTVSSISKPGTGGSDQDKNQGTDTKKEDSKKTDGTNTGVFVGTGLFAGSATAAAAGASLLAFLKKRKK